MIDIVEGDAFELIQTLDSNSANCAVIDYPWEFSTQNGTKRFGFDDEEREDFYKTEPLEKIEDIFNELKRVLVDGSWIFCFADDDIQDELRSLMKKHFTFRRNWAWSIAHFGMGAYGRVNHYPVPVATLGETERYARDRPTMFNLGGGREKGYYTAKPMEVYRRMLAPPILQEGDRLIEPFCGTAPGAQLVRERQNENVSYWGCDVNPKALDLARERSVDKPKSLLET